jgi:hypothetical protein
MATVARAMATAARVRPKVEAATLTHFAMLFFAFSEADMRLTCNVQSRRMATLKVADIDELFSIVMVHLQQAKLL